MKDSRTIPCMAASLKDENSMFACWPHGDWDKMGEPALKPLLAELADKNSPGRSDAAFALGKINQPKRPSLSSRLSRKRIQSFAKNRQGPVRITGQDFVKALRTGRKWWREQMSSPDSRDSYLFPAGKKASLVNR